MGRSQPGRLMNKESRRQYTLPRRFLLWLLLPALTGCSSQEVLMVHPRTGATVRCQAAGAGLMAGVVAATIAECKNYHERQGYVSSDELSAEQRSDLESRGVQLNP